MIHFNSIDPDTLARIWGQKNPATVDRSLLGGVTLPQQLDHDCWQPSVNAGGGCYLDNINTEFEEMEKRNKADQDAIIKEQDKNALEEREKREKKLSEDLADLVEYGYEKWQEKKQETYTDNMDSNQYNTNLNPDDSNVDLNNGYNSFGTDTYLDDEINTDPFSSNNGYNSFGTDTYLDDGISTDPFSSGDDFSGSGSFDTFDDFSSF